MKITWSCKKTDPVIRFWSHVNKNGSVPSHVPGLGNCWEWKAARSANGYGVFFPKYKHRQYAHRYSWHMATGIEPGNRYVLHSCDNPPCVNPGHLFLGTHADNMADMVAKGRQHRDPSRWRGTENPKAILSHERAAEIRRIYRSGDITQLELALKLGMSKSAIARAIRGVTWRRA